MITEVDGEPLECVTMEDEGISHTKYMPGVAQRGSQGRNKNGLWEAA